MLCDQYLYLLLEHTHHCTGKPRSREAFLSISPTLTCVTLHPFPQPLAVTHVSIVFRNLPILDFSPKWNSVICGLSCWASFAKHHILKVPLCRLRGEDFIPFFG